MIPDTPFAAVRMPLEEIPCRGERLARLALLPKEREYQDLVTLRVPQCHGANHPQGTESGLLAADVRQERGRVQKGFSGRGIPDVIAIKGGAVFALELKAPRGRTSEAQVATHLAMRAAGANVTTAIGLDEAISQLELWGLLRGRASIGSASALGCGIATGDARRTGYG
jgi:hypothetical protein